MALPAGVQSGLNEKIDRHIQDWVGTYRYLHANPELSTQEKETSAFLASELKKVGQVQLTEGVTHAGADSVDITIRGYGGHGARPYMTKDPIVIASELVVFLQTIVSREMNPLDPTVVTVGSFHAGTKHSR